jgi:hypothetical protein
MKLISLHWNTDKEEGQVKYTEEFSEAPTILKLDMLQDVIAELQDMYNSLLSPKRETE